MTVCVPDGTDWLCSFTQEQLDEMRADAASSRMMDVAEAYAWSLLASLTAYQVATCPIAVRPCAARCIDGGGMMAFPVSAGLSGALGNGGGSFNPHMVGGKWYNSCGCRRASDCSCSQLSEVRLPGPVGGIVSVTVDGLVLPTTSYRVDNGNRLVRLDGETWPACQDMSLPANAVGAFEVVYYRGAAPNNMTRHAAGALAVEFYAACAGDDCRLPDNVTSVARQGVDYELTPTDFPEGVTGIKAVDALIRIYNPNKLKGRVTISSPDAPMTRTPTWSR